MALADRLGQFFDVSSNRQKAHGPGYKPHRPFRANCTGESSCFTGGRLWAPEYARMALLRRPRRRVPRSDAQALRLLYGRANLAEQRQHSEAEDVMAFANQCTAEHLFDFIEASFRLDVSTRMFGEENQFVGALNDIFRRDGAPFQVLPGLTREEPGPRSVSIIRVAFPRVVRVDEEAAH